MCVIVLSLPELGDPAQGPQDAALKLIADVARAHGVEIQLEKVEDVQAMMRYPIMSTPAVVVDEQVVHSGSVPSRSKVEGWLQRR